MRNLRLLNPTLCCALCVGFAAVWAGPQTGAEVLDVMVPMRDGVKLAATVYTPEGDGPWPVIATRTPYNKDGWRNRHAQFTDAGYAFVAQDCRGRFASEGEYVPFEPDMQDGYDTVEWIAAQEFCNGKVGIEGASAMGITSNLAAAADPPHLVAAYVIVAPQSLFSESRFIGGVFKESHAGGWMRGQGVPEQIPAMKRRVVMDDRWKATDLVHHVHNIDIPMYNVGGWYDIFAQGSIDNFVYLQNHGRPGARGNQKLLMGAFGHGQLSGDIEYPDGGRLGRNDDEIRWFDYWLKGVDNGIMDEPAVRYYQMASARKENASAHNRWIETDTWPPNHTPTAFYLQPEFGLSTVPPDTMEAFSDYTFDPENPVPTAGGANLRIEKGPMDQRVISGRDDYLRFETAPLQSDLLISGPINFELYAATDASDTDFMVKLVDVYPDGYEAIVADNPIRARYRLGRTPDDVRMMAPGVPAKFDISLWNSAMLFEKGHKIAVHVTSSNYPRFEVNPNTGEAPGEATMKPRTARNTIYHDAMRPSALILPVVERIPAYEKDSRNPDSSVRVSQTAPAD